MKDFIVPLLLVLTAIHAATAPGPRDADWRAVAAAMDQRLPRTALERLNSIIDASIRDRAWGEAARAIGRRVTLESEIEGNQPGERVQRFVRALNSVPVELQPIFHSLVAHAYWGYFQQDRWRIQRRTSTAEAGDDFQTWDLARLFREIDREFTLSFTNAAALKAIPIAAFGDLLEAGTMPDRYRPTLYDFLVHEALEFYSAGEQAGARPEDAFTLEASSPVLGDVRGFLAWRPVSTDTNAVALKAIGLFQELLRFHERDADPSAFLQADLDRLRYAGNIAVGPDKDARQITALRAFAHLHIDHETSALAHHLAAVILHRAGRNDEAHAEASAGTVTFPESPGGKLCRNLLREIEAPETHLQAERVWNSRENTLDVTHRNTPTLWFRVVASDWNRFLDRRRHQPEAMSHDERIGLLAEKPVLSWSTNLPPTPDFKDHVTRMPVPDLRPGFYFILASRRADFAEANNEVTFLPFWVSNLSLVIRSRAGRWEGLVLQAGSGTPVAGAKVESWNLDPTGNRMALPAQTTDADGTFAFDRPELGRNHLFKATFQNQAVATGNDLWWGGAPEPATAQESTVFFTDRALYRPGQLIQYKGISIVADPQRSRFEPLAGRELTVLLRDSNGAEIARARHRANDFGSFSGTFTAPRSGITGVLELLVEGAPAGATALRVEEYKRPRFHVQINPPTEALRLMERATLRGRATTYTGDPVDGATIHWRVSRQVRFPEWRSWFRRGPIPGSESQEIAHGTGVTTVDGSFTIDFTALPDLSVPEADAPTFQFAVHADVSDAAGETRSVERTLSIGYTAIAAELSAEAWQTPRDPVAIQVATRTLDGEGTPTSGTLVLHALKQPDRVHRGRLQDAIPFRDDKPLDPSNPNSWELGDEVARQPFQTGTNGVVTNHFVLPPGIYRAQLDTRDRFGKPVTARLEVMVLDPDAPRLGIRVPSLVAARSWRVEPGGDFVLLWGTGYDEGRAFIELERDGKILHRIWTDAGRTQQRISRPVTENFRGGFTVHVTYVRENRLYQESRRVDVPWTNKDFDVTWGTFRSKLEPGQTETWTASIRPTRPASSDQRPGESIAAEMVATLYDASLDAFAPFAWPEKFDCFPQDYSTAQTTFANALRTFDIIRGGMNLDQLEVEIRYRSFPPDLVEKVGMMPVTAFSAVPASRLSAVRFKGGTEADATAKQAEAAGPQPTESTVDPDNVVPRRNLQETAFFLPQLTSDSNGIVRMTFTLPEALTEWRFLGFAHDRGLRAGRLEGRAVTSRDLMVLPNPPRFLREGDVLEFTSRVVNRSDTAQVGRIRLTLTQALDGTPADAAVGNNVPELGFEVPAKESRTYSWKLTIPDGCGFLTYKVIAASDRLSDGEEGYLPILQRRVFLTESLPLPIRGPGKRDFVFTNLLASATSPSLRHEGLTVQMVSNPAWYAVLALPCLMEYPYECTEQVFHRYYANSLARHIAGSDPRIRAIFDQWRGTEALESPLEKNDDLKSIALEETPWLRQARNESEAHRKIGLLFENNRLGQELDLALRKLADSQMVDGGWPWFPGGPPDETMSLIIVAGFGRLHHLGVQVPLEVAVRALGSLDAAMQARWQRLRDRRELDGVRLDPTVALYLYARAFFLKDHPIPDAHKGMFAYWIGQAQKHWSKLENRQSQGHVALSLWRCGNLLPVAQSVATPKAIVRSLRERAVNDEELGMFWREDEQSWWWYRAPIETQALMIELFDEVADDTAAVEDLRVWLLKQKQTQDWGTTKATADAVYAILLRGTNLLGNGGLVQVNVGDRNITAGRGPAIAPRRERDTRGAGPSAPEPGTGFFETRFPGADVSPALAQISIRKQDAGVAWGSAHWQYFEDLGKVRAHDGTALQVTKSLFTRVTTRTGQELVPVRGPLKVGDELIVRMELRVDRAMEYVHLKDQRGSGTEPVNVLSQHQFQDGLVYYESTRDTATHFFIAQLPKGTYVFEYPLRIQHRGDYPAGFALVECLYAPEFNSHSANTRLQVE